MKCLLVSTLTFEIKFVGLPASTAYLCYMYLMTTFKILVIEYLPIYRISKFSYSLKSLLASVTKIPYRSGPSSKIYLMQSSLPQQIEPIHLIKILQDLGVQHDLQSTSVRLLQCSLAASQKIKLYDVLIQQQLSFFKFSYFLCIPGTLCLTSSEVKIDESLLQNCSSSC